MPAANFYQVLHVSPDATPAQIESAYRRLARRYHPDLNKAPDATAQMQTLNEAYAVLRDPQKRAAYDRKRTGPAAKKPAAPRTSAKPAPRRAPAPAASRDFSSELAAADIRARLLELNDPAKPYTVTASAGRIILRPRQASGYQLEITFDEAGRLAQLIETNPAYGPARLKREARQVLAAHGWRTAE